MASLQFSDKLIQISLQKDLKLVIKLELKTETLFQWLKLKAYN